DLDKILRQVHANENCLSAIRFLCEDILGRTVTLPSEVPPGVDLSLRPWSRPRLPSEVIFHFGKESGRTVLVTFNPKTRSWKDHGAVKSSWRHGHCLAVHGKDVYVIGGISRRGYLNRVSSFSTEDTMWRPRGPMESSIYVVGGFNSSGPLRSAERYDVHTDMWVRIASMRDHRMGASAAAACGRVIVALDKILRQVHANENCLSAIRFLCEDILGRTATLPSEVPPGVDLSLRPWSRPRLPIDVLFHFAKESGRTVLVTFNPKTRSWKDHGAVKCSWR
ncbi:hypothetical protein MTO96_041401, partial [Rhipicephalus appendiculatus]